MSTLSFDSDIATKFGINEAILLNNFQHWVRLNKYNKSQFHFHDGKYWVYYSQEALAQLFPFWSLRTVQRTIASMIEQNLIISCQPNKSKYDRTTWYSLSKKMWRFYEPDNLSHIDNSDDDKMACSMRQNDILEPDKVATSEHDKVACSEHDKMAPSCLNSHNNNQNNSHNITPKSPSENLWGIWQAIMATQVTNFNQKELDALRNWAEHKKITERAVIQSTINHVKRIKMKAGDIEAAIDASISGAYGGIIDNSPKFNNQPIKQPSIPHSHDGQNYDPNGFTKPYAEAQKAALSRGVK